MEISAKPIEHFQMGRPITTSTIAMCTTYSATYVDPILNPSALLSLYRSQNAQETTAGTCQNAVKISAMERFVKPMKRFRTDNLITTLTIADIMMFSGKCADRNQLILLGVVGLLGVNVREVVAVASSIGVALALAAVALAMHLNQNLANLRLAVLQRGVRGLPGASALSLAALAFSEEPVLALDEIVQEIQQSQNHAQLLAVTPRFGAWVGESVHQTLASTPTVLAPVQRPLPSAEENAKGDPTVGDIRRLKFLTQPVVEHATCMVTTIAMMQGIVGSQLAEQRK